MEQILTTWLLTYAVHSAMFAALAFVAECTRWGAVASRRDAFLKLALVGGVVTSTVFVVAGSAPAARGMPSPGVADARPAPRTSTMASVALSRAAAADRSAVSEIALDEPLPAATSGQTPSAVGLEAVAAPTATATRLRDAIAAARITPAPALSRTRFDEPDLERRVLNWVLGERGRFSFDPNHPKY